ncbi:hypothetical protein BGAPBR_K0016 (plasmid) [Borreliella garinii PBr]|uniref:Uncharacterized protein n=1 Tax=Borreliella garinii PBr TaxID=498743 RepID=B8F0P9_BORGR|nr:hypothetical protein BGAPBR_K0016 [Borreliella garinii PBr]
MVVYINIIFNEVNGEDIDQTSGINILKVSHRGCLILL